MLWRQEISHQESKRKESQCWEESESDFSGRHTDNFPKETHVVPVMTQLLSENSGAGRRRIGRSSSTASHSKAKQTDGKGQKSSQGSGSKQENSLDKSEIPCRFKFCQNPSCNFWHPSRMSESQVWKRIYVSRQMPFPTSWGRGEVQQKAKEMRRKRLSCFNEGGKLESKHAVTLSKATWNQMKKTGKKGFIARAFPKVLTSWAQSLRAQIWGENTWGDLAPRRCARGEAWDLAKNMYTLRNSDKTIYLCFSWVGKRRNDSGAGTHCFEKARGARIRSWFRSITAHDEQKRIKLRRDGRDSLPTEKCTAVLSLGKLCEDHGYLSGCQRSKATMDHKWEKYFMQNRQFRTSCRSWHRYTEQADQRGQGSIGFLSKKGREGGAFSKLSSTTAGITRGPKMEKTAVKKVLFREVFLSTISQCDAWLLLSVFSCFFFWDSFFGTACLFQGNSAE